MKGIVTFLFLFLTSLSFGQEVRYVYSSTTAGAIDELNSLVSDKGKRNAVVQKIKELESKNLIVLSSVEYELFQNEYLSISERKDFSSKDYSDLKSRLVQLSAKYINVKDVVKAVLDEKK